MENLELNTKEKKELEKRGFFVKENFNLKDLGKSIINIISYFGIAVNAMVIPLLLSLLIYVLFKNNLIMNISMIITYGGMGVILSLSILNFLLGYLRSGKTFITNNGVIEFGKIGTKGFFKKRQYIFFINHWIEKIINSGTGGKGGVLISILYIFFISYFTIFGLLGLKLTYNIIPDIITGTIPFLYIVAFLTGFAFSLLLSRGLFQLFHPLYAFGNIGEKIQKITPQIEEQSKQIQSEFESDMNYSVLSDGFDSLSATFADIVSLVIKLEKVEARANKGNLFDSEKYINSLKSDIVTPLSSLKIFLEKQKTELIQSQKELTRVRVGGHESTGNMELQSKRSESLIQELTENIEKLDMMIGKMG